MASASSVADATAMEPRGNNDENSPLLPSSDIRARHQRMVTFNADPVIRTIEPDFSPPLEARGRRFSDGNRTFSSTSNGTSNGTSAGPPPVLSALNSKLRRRSSHTSIPVVFQPPAGPKIGPQRSTKKTEKLKLLPNPDLDEGEDEDSGRDVYSQYTRIKDPTARRDAARLGKRDRDRLPRVTAYCTANRYQMDALMRFLKGRGKTRGANPKLIDECIYTPYSYSPPDKDRQVLPRNQARHDVAYSDDGPIASADDMGQFEGQDLLGPASDQDPHMADATPDFDIQVQTPEVFLFDYGVVVIWGMSQSQESRFLKEMAKFELEKLAPDDVETERFNFYYTREYQARIYNDFITLRDRNNYMIKLAISHALAQSVKVSRQHYSSFFLLIRIFCHFPNDDENLRRWRLTLSPSGVQTSLFEELITSTIDTCKDIPTQIALTGKIALSRSQINMQIGELFILRINIHLNGSVLDTPELFWVEPELEPVYQAVRSYLEMDQRVGLVTERLDVIADLLAVLKDQLSHGHGEKLEWIGT